MNKVKEIHFRDEFFEELAYSREEQLERAEDPNAQNDDLSKSGISIVNPRLLMRFEQIGKEMLSANAAVKWLKLTYGYIFESFLKTEKHAERVSKVVNKGKDTMVGRIREMRNLWLIKLAKFIIRMRAVLSAIENAKNLVNQIKHAISIASVGEMNFAENALLLAVSPSARNLFLDVFILEVKDDVYGLLQSIVDIIVAPLLVDLLIVAREVFYQTVYALLNILPMGGKISQGILRGGQMVAKGSARFSNAAVRLSASAAVATPEIAGALAVSGVVAKGVSRGLGAVSRGIGMASPVLNIAVKTGEAAKVPLSAFLTYRGYRKVYNFGYGGMYFMNALKDTMPVLNKAVNDFIGMFKIPQSNTTEGYGLKERLFTMGGNEVEPMLNTEEIINGVSNDLSDADISKKLGDAVLLNDISRLNAFSENVQAGIKNFFEEEMIEKSFFAKRLFFNSSSVVDAIKKDLFGIEETIDKSSTMQNVRNYQMERHGENTSGKMRLEVLYEKNKNDYKAFAGVNNKILKNINLIKLGSQKYTIYDKDGTPLKTHTVSFETKNEETLKNAAEMLKLNYDKQLTIQDNIIGICRETNQRVLYTLYKNNDAEAVHASQPQLNNTEGYDFAAGDKLSNAIKASQPIQIRP